MSETTAPAPPAQTQDSLSPVLGAKLSVMMFLQYAIWGIWAPILGVYLGGMPAFQLADGSADFFKIGLIYMSMPIASIIGPFIGGQIADRYFAAQRFLGVSQILGGVLLLLVTQATSFAGVFVGMLAYNLIYAPTIALTNSITFQHWPNERFSRIRVWGSIGWIVIGLAFSFVWMKSLGHLFHEPRMADCLYIAAALSIVYGLYSFLLPHTPPSKQSGNPLAFLEAVGMLRNPAFAIMAAISFLVAIELQLYFVWGGPFLNKAAGVAEDNVLGVLSIGQICEMVMMVLLPLALRKYGFRVTMAIGIAAWALRDFVFALGLPTPVIIGAVALHGVGFAFFFTTIFMFADAIAPKDIKSSAQAFLASVTIGCGMLVGSLLAGPITSALDGNWQKVYMVPAILLGTCFVVFLLGFRPKQDEAPATVEAEPA